MNRKRGSALMALILIGVFLAAIDDFPNAEITALGQVGTSVGGIIGDNTTWTAANSPYNLTGNILVNNGVTLTIEAGATVNLNSYYIMVNGSLIVKGDNADQIYLNGGANEASINFTQYSVGWDNQTDFGSIIENAIINSIAIYTSKPLKVTNTTLNGEITVGDYSLITNSAFVGREYPFYSNPCAVTTGKSSLILDNIVNGTQYEVNFLGDYGYSCRAIDAGGLSIISNNIVIGDIDGDFLNVTNNNVVGKIRGNSIVVSNNLITGPESIIIAEEGVHYSISAIYSSGGSSTLVNNTIHYTKGTYPVSYYSDTGYGITVQSGFSYISGNKISGTLTGIRCASDCIVEDNSMTNSFIGVEVGTIKFSYLLSSAGNVTIRNNAIINNTQGIVSKLAGGSAIIENNKIYNTTNGINVVSQITLKNNLIFENSYGIIIGSQGLIQNNTIANNSIGIKINSPLPTIAYNNIQHNSIYHLQLDSTIQNDFNATNNWWGTINSTIIDQHIYDFYDDFNLGKVTYIPFLNQPNPNAPTIQFYNFNVLVETQSFSITAISNSAISELSFNQTLKELKFDVEGIPETTGFCNIIIPADLMSGTFSLFKDYALLVKDVDYTETYNVTHYTFQILYNHSIHTIRIISSQVIPELPSNLLMVLITISLSAATLFFRKKLLKSQK